MILTSHHIEVATRPAWLKIKTIQWNIMSWVFIFLKKLISLRQHLLINWKLLLNVNYQNIEFTNFCRCFEDLKEQEVCSTDNSKRLHRKLERRYDKKLKPFHIYNSSAFAFSASAAFCFSSLIFLRSSNFSLRFLSSISTSTLAIVTFSLIFNRYGVSFPFLS